MMKTKTLIIGAFVMPLLVACGDDGTSYSISPSGQTFKQASSSVNNKIDMLWVIDNSSSMTPLQQNMTANFNSFIDQFVTKNLDFHMAVTTTDAYLANAIFQNDPRKSVFKDGGANGATGIFDILTTTPNLITTFVTNAYQGATGDGDERAFSSFQEALNNPSNAGFLRSNSFFGIIILSDEDDFSNPDRPQDSWIYPGGQPDHDYSNPNLQTVDSYVSYLDTLTNSTGATRRYSVSSIAVLDQTCYDTHVLQSPSSVIGQRYIQISNQTNGVTGSICDSSYASSLEAIQEHILELGTQFYLARTPEVSTITVVVNGVSVPNDPTNGWTYNSTANSIVFHGTAIPAAGASISINFQPASLNF